MNRRETVMNRLSICFQSSSRRPFGDRRNGAVGRGVSETSKKEITKKESRTCRNCAKCKQTEECDDVSLFFLFD